MRKARNTLAATAAATKRDTVSNPYPTPQRTQADRYIRSHTPDSPYGDHQTTADEE